MYAIVEIAGQQFKVEKDQKVFVNRLATEEGKKVDFDNVLLIGNDKDITIGAPAIDGALVSAKVLKHLKGDKVIVFKKKRRKGYRVKNGHRQSLTEIVIEGITAKGGSPKKAEKAEPKVKKEATSKATASKKTNANPEKQDDLKKIEGIGPKAAEALANAGLGTFEAISKSTSDQLKDILSEASSRLAHLVTDTWPKQAKLAANGKWDELAKLQDKLEGGIEK